MHINLEAAEKYSIKSYDEQGIEIDSQIYRQSLIASAKGIIAEWPIATIHQLNEETLKPLLNQKPKVIIIGHKQSGQFPSTKIIQSLAKNGIGLECMSIGAACRTYNVLLGEFREVVVGLIL